MARLDAVRSWPWFAIVVPLFPLLHIASANPGQVGAVSLGTTLGAGLALTAALWLVLRGLLGDGLRAGLGAAWSAILFFSFGPIDAQIVRSGASAVPDALAGVWPGDFSQLVQTAIWLALLVVGWIGFRSLPRIPERLPSALNFVALVLLGLTSVQYLAGAESGETGAHDAGARGVAAQDAPDIYFIVLDGYARADVLAKYYGHDNGPFLRRLEEHGFQVAEASRANYNWTFLSLSSTLNLDYLPELLGNKLNPTGKDRKHTYELVRDNRAADLLRERGYRFVHLQSTWGATSKNPHADEFRPCGGGLFQDDYLLAVQEASWLRVFNSKASLDLASCHLRNFETLAGLAREAGPKFVLAHFVPPHHPYLFARDGRVLREANLSNQFEFQKRLWEDRDAYRDQLIFMSESIEGVIDRLIADSKRPPVILLISDHGPNIVDGLTQEEHSRVRLATLSAIHVPGAPADLIPEDISNVNLLRIVFDELFETGLASLPVHQFMSTHHRPFYFMEVDWAGNPVKPTPVVADNR